MQNDTQMETIQFNYGDNLIRVIKDDVTGEQLWVAKDVCDVLGMSDAEVALRKLDNDEKLNRKIYGAGKNRNMMCVNESGLYTLILRSNKPEAKAFKHWVTHDVLPSIRKTGSYSTTQQANTLQSKNNYNADDAINALILTSVDGSLKSTVQVLSMYKFTKLTASTKNEADVCILFDTIIEELIATRSLVQSLMPTIQLPNNTGANYRPKPVMKCNSDVESEQSL